MASKSVTCSCTIESVCHTYNHAHTSKFVQEGNPVLYLTQQRHKYQGLFSVNSPCHIVEIVLVRVLSATRPCLEYRIWDV